MFKLSFVTLKLVCASITALHVALIWGVSHRTWPHVIWHFLTPQTHCWQHYVQFSYAINQPLLAHHWRVHQCLLTWGFIAPSILWRVSGKMRKQLLKDHNFLNNSPIFIIENSTFNIFAFQKALHTMHSNLKNCFGFGEMYLTPWLYGRMWVPAVSKHMKPLKWD